MMALGDELGADDDVDTAFRNLRQLGAHGLDRGDEIARQHHAARFRKQRGRLLLQPFDAGANRDQGFLRRAMRTRLRPVHREAAVMAYQPLAKAMIDQPSVADGAGEAMAAGTA